MRKLLAFVAFLVLGVILFSFVVRAVGWSEVWEAAGEFWGGKGLLLLIFTLLMLGAGALRWREILRHQGYYVPFSSLLKQYLGGFSLSFFFPMAFFGNELFRSYTLQEFHQVPLPRAIVSVVVERILEVTMYLLLLGAGIAFLLISKSVLIPTLFWWILSGIGMLALALAFFYFKSHRKESIVRIFFPRLKGTNGFLEMEQELLRFFNLRNRAFWEGIFLSFAKVSFALLRTLVLVGFLGKFIGFFPAVAITGFIFLSLLVPIPGQLGSHEALQVLAFQSLGLEGHTGAAFAFLVRAAEFVFAFGGLILFFRLGASLFQRLMFSKVERLFQKLFS
ncbi:MAG: lysylphosphatidylglycerol synthase transmembrane domain-containing protein [bacterium]|nr:lysylphosphatidylglycerol synthase transmembrane domain-containing protein [bacterium]